MEKIIKIGDREVKLNNNMAWLMEYKDQFGKDILPVIMPLISTGMETIAGIISETGGGSTLSFEAIANTITGRVQEITLPLYTAELTEIIINTTWAMAKCADDNIDPPNRWIRQFDTFPLDVVIPEVLGLAVKGSVSEKNWKRLKDLLKIRDQLKTIQPSIQTLSSSQDSKEG